MRFFSVAAFLSKTVTTSDLWHKSMSMFCFKKHLILQPNWGFLMSFQISHGLIDCVHDFLRTRINVAIEKIRGKAISNVLMLHMVVIELQHVHQLPNFTKGLLPKADLITLKVEYDCMVPL